MPSEKCKIVSFTSPIMKNIVASSGRFIFPVKLVCCTAFGSASSAYCLRESITIIL